MKTTAFSLTLLFLLTGLAYGLQPQLVSVKSDFVPGEKIVFYDDFSDMLGDEPPPHWRVRGAAVELKTDGKVRQLTTARKASVELTPNLTQLPANFTVETDIMWAPPMYNAQVYWYFGPKAGAKSLIVWVSTRSPDSGTMARGGITLRGDSGDLGSGDFQFDLTRSLTLELWMQNGRLRVYTNGERVVDVNQVQLPKIGAAWMELNPYDGPIGLRRVRLAESAPDFSQVISSSGRYVTHGIHFDTDSDRLTPDSGPVMKMVADGLKRNPAMKLLIEGHTDSTGDAKHNLELSQKRAGAVKSTLAGQFGIEENRLAVAGLGATKPISTNDTPQGRADNRRVEFVRQ
jgi:OOP family OmpA-OmpF porin